LTHDQKVALVTGASRGIGAATARLFAQSGIAVVLAARDEQALEALSKEITAAGGKAKAAVCDVTQYQDVLAAVESAQQHFGGLDILLNNAGIIDPIARLAESDPDAWGRVIDVNTKGVYHGLRATLPIMQAQGSGVIINISSGAATNPLEGWSHYCSSKAAVLALTRCADKEYADSGVRVVGLSPGTVATDMQISIKSSGINPVSEMAATDHIPAEWVAKAALWLCTDEAAAFNGTDFTLKTNEGRELVGLPPI